MRRRQGFTFIEIMMVLVIVGMLVAISMPRMRGTFGVTQMKGAGRELTGMLRFARNTAIVSGKPCEIRFDTENDSYELVLLDENMEPVERERSYHRRDRDEPAPLDASEDVAGIHELPEGIHFQAIYGADDAVDDKDLPRIIYYTDGTATPAVIALQDDRKRALSVEIFRTTGMARVSQGLPPEEPKLKRLYIGPDRD